MNFDALVWQQWVILGYALPRTLHTHRHAAPKRRPSRERLCTSRSGSSSSRARADPSRDLPAGIAITFHRRAATRKSRTKPPLSNPARRHLSTFPAACGTGGQVRPRSRFASGGRGQRPGSPFDSATVHCDRVNVAPSHATDRTRGMPVRAGSDGHGRLRLLRPHHRVQRDRNPQTQQRPAMGSHADLPPLRRRGR